MGKKNKSNTNSLGRSLIKDRFGSSKGKKMVANNSMLHTTEIEDGYDWGRLNLQSVTEESSFQEFLSTAELADKEFKAEKLNIKFINPRSNVGILTANELKTAKELHQLYETHLRIPRRPKWDSKTTSEELDRNEKEQFLNWRRSLAQLQENHGILLTPYEKNLEFWRQLWRVVERSDVIVQIVDARNPLLFRCEDLEKYVKEVSPNKMNMILINKADFMTEPQRQAWADYFASINVRVAFFSAHLAELESVAEENDEPAETVTSEEESSDLEVIRGKVAQLEKAVEKNAETLNNVMDIIGEMVGKVTTTDSGAVQSINSSHLYSKNELIELFKTIHKGSKVTKDLTTIGLVGYPNVGKSSTINALLSAKKVSVSATPGKTKHFQTLYLDKDVLLCDCPGLVMPSFVCSKAEMILNGILPIDQMRDHVPPTNLLTSSIPRHVLEDKYGIMMPKPMEGEDPDRAPVAEELLNTYAFSRGYMTANGQPDNARASRYVLKDYMNGKLLYCCAPPGVEQKSYHTWPERQRIVSEDKVLPPRAVRAAKSCAVSSQDVDKEFFQSSSRVHTKGVGKVFINNGESTPDYVLVEKPWKQYNKHKNKGKKEKQRRIYAHLDQH